MVVSSPDSMPKQASSTWAIGAAQFVLQAVVSVLVDAHDDGGVDVGAGRGDDDLAGARPQVCRRGGAGAKQAGRLHDDVDAEVLPWKIVRIGLLQDADLATIDVEPTT